MITTNIAIDLSKSAIVGNILANAALVSYLGSQLGNAYSKIG
jgi:hypothetical protein